MAKQTINIGTSPNDGTGTPLRTSFDYCNLNFTELYTATGPSGNNIVVPGNATITGDLTVDTSTLKVDSTNNRVGIGTASPTVQLHLAGTDSTNVLFAGVTKGIRFVQSASTSLITGVDNTGAASYQPLSIGGSALDFSLSGTTAMTLNSSGNIGIGVTPSAWSSDTKAIQLGGSTFSAFAANIRFLGLTNALYDGTNYKYLNNGNALQYRMSGGTGTHEWYNAASGTAGNNITFTQAMTLDASGNLLVGKTADSNLTVGCTVKPTGEFQSTEVGATNSNTCYDLYSTTAVAYRFYVGMGGTVFATNTVISAISDARLKENVQNLDVGLNEILALKPRKFDWKAGKGKDIKGDRGFIAQEFETVFPHLIDEWKDPAPEGEAPYKSVRADLIPVLVKAIQELTARVQTIEAR